MSYTKAELEAENAKMREQIDAARKVIEEGYPDQPAKYAKCKHDRFGYEDCIACYDEALLKALGAKHD